MTRAASSAGTHSTTMAKAPAASTARASSRMRSASRCTLKPPSRRTDCGVRPMCPITGMSADATAATAAALRTPPSNLTAWAPPSLTSRPALATACCGLTW